MRHREKASAMYLLHIQNQEQQAHIVQVQLSNKIFRQIIQTDGD